MVSDLLHESYKRALFELRVLLVLYGLYKRASCPREFVGFVGLARWRFSDLFGSGS